MSQVEKQWRVVDSKDVGAIPEKDRDYARWYRIAPIASEGPTSETTIEFAATSGATANDASKVLGEYLLKDERPPGRLVVYRDGRVSVEAE